ncbi:MAG: type II toxin-antitoxin system VapC family toxin [Chitinophagales bacterium]
MVKHIAIDTNIAIALLNNQTTVFSILNKFDVIYIPVTVCGELLFGAKNSKLSVKNTKRYVEFIQSCELLDSNLIVAQNYASIRLNLKLIGKPIPENDIWIAAICMTNNIPLFTADKHFSYIEQLKVITT